MSRLGELNPARHAARRLDKIAAETVDPATRTAIAKARVMLETLIVWIEDGEDKAMDFYHDSVNPIV